MWAEVCDLNYVGRSVYPAEYNIWPASVVVVSEKNTPREPVRSINRLQLQRQERHRIRSSRLGAPDIAAIAAAAAAALLLQAILKLSVR